MKINKLQINDFGKFSNKEINLKDSINVIKGNNESGKSTIQKFLVSILYGINRDKRKSNFTDYDKYFPWGKESFSGKINYTLDDGQTYEVYRDFTKKMPIVYNENAEDITKKYSSSKSKGSNFFEEQTGIDEKIMMSSMVTEQSSVVIDQASENFVIQKIANIAETGDEKISYDKALAYLTKKRNEEVGTDKTRNRPINILNDEKRNLTLEKEELEKYSNEQYEIEENIKNIKNRQEKNEKLLKFAIDYKNILDYETEMKNKISVYDENIIRNNNEQEELIKQKETIRSNLKKAENEYNQILKREEKEELERNQEIDKLNKIKKKKSVIFICMSTLLLISSIIAFVIKLIPVGVVLFIMALLGIVIGNTSKKKANKLIEEHMNNEKSTRSEEQKLIIDEIKNELKEVELKNEVLRKNSEETNKHIDEISSTLKKNEDVQIRELIRKHSDVTEDDYREILEGNKVLKQLQTLQNISNNNKLELQKYVYRKNYIMPKLERLTEIQERLYDLYDKEEELIEQANAITLAGEVLKESYEEMKENVVPKFTENLSNTISKISNGKYSKVVTNDKDGLLVEKENGEYIPAKALSIGTIDQLYLSLRFAITEEATNQKMPLILDEAFAYYDNERLEEILKYISHQFSQNQVILFTCTSREIDTLNKLNIKYNLIEI